MPKAYCTKCATNWGELKEIGIDENNEFHDVCPKCETSLFLIDAKEGEALMPYKPFEYPANILQTRKFTSVPQNSKEAIEAYKQIDAKRLRDTLNY